MDLDLLEIYKLKLILTKKQFEKRWYILRHWIKPENRQEVINWFSKNKALIDNNTSLEITQRDYNDTINTYNTKKTYKA